MPTTAVVSATLGWQSSSALHEAAVASLPPRTLLFVTNRADHGLSEIKAEVLDSQTSTSTSVNATTPTASYKYSLGVIAEKTGGSKWKMLVDISASEYKEIVSALVVLARLEPPFHAGLVERNYCDLQAMYQFVTITLSLGREFASPNRRQLANSVATSIVNWLTAMRLFLDHEETELKAPVRKAVGRGPGIHSGDD
jgi:hypothetical protein